MLQKISIVFLFATGVLFAGCQEHLLKDKNKREEIHANFQQRSKDILLNRQEQLLDVFNTELSVQEREALEFLYAYETLSDLSNYDADYYLQQIRSAFKARETFSWGKTVSDEDFLHFVLPPRAGTENMDSARVVIFNELKERIKNMGMKEAALEVNHWCHEKVTYVGSDGRTSAPLALMKNAKGRCGEESVFTVTALRAVGIPARQIYTPRWVHQDDNHAWVEFWADGQWYFMGACEPEADVNQGWFVEPSRRAILTATQTPGHYSASDVIHQREYFTRLNQIENYATAKDLFVKVVDKQNKPLVDVEVGFLVCNYAELYNLAPLKTDERGICGLKLGLGDVVVWATDETKFSFKKVTVADTDTLTIALSESDFTERVVDIDLVPPVAKEPLEVSEEGKKLNRIRLAYEDSIRTAYEKTFLSKEKAFVLADELGLDTTEVWQIIKKSRGNHQDIAAFMQQTPVESKKWMMPLLNAVSAKDLRDASASVLLSHIQNTPEFSGQYTEDDYARFLLNPRIEMEQLSPYKAYLKPKFEETFWTAVKENPSVAEKWILDHIKISKTENYIWVPSTPKGVYEMKTCDLGSAKVLFVALCRTAGVLSRVDRITGTAQYKKDDQWVNVYLGEAQPQKSEAVGTISLVQDKVNRGACRYAKQFTIAKFENGYYKTLEYKFNKEVNDFPEKLDLVAGNYMLYTAEREKDGTVLSRMQFFTLDDGEHKDMVVSLRTDSKPLQSMGKFFLPPVYEVPVHMQGLYSYHMSLGKVMIWIDPDKEPTKHVLKDFEELKELFDATGLPFVFIVPNDERANVFNPKDYHLPEDVMFVKDDSLFKLFQKASKQDLKNQLPVLALVSGDNDILFLSSGYKIGAGDQLLKVMRKYQGIE
jgi:hypothetical protein